MRKYISRFHYLTQDLPQRTHLEQAVIACEAGVNWIQYRCLTKTNEELISEIDPIAQLCDEWGVTLILTDHYHLLDKVDAQGVHIEDFDADFGYIRSIIGDDKTMGGSATNIDHLRKVQASGVVDYCGYGPFAYTETKPNNESLLGYAGYKELEKYPDVKIPIIAVGGITLFDAEPLLQTGVFGIAASSAINKAVDPATAVKEFYRKAY